MKHTDLDHVDTQQSNQLDSTSADAAFGGQDNSQVCPSYHCQDDTDETCSTLRSLSRCLVRKLGLLDSVLGDLPLSPVQAHTLIELNHQELSIKQLSEILNIDKSNASRAISQLCEKHFARTRNNPKDSRSSLCQLTPQGKRLLNKLNKQQNRLFEQILAQLSDAAIVELETALTGYTRAIDLAELQQDYCVRIIEADDDAAMAAVIREVSAEYGLTPDKGYGVADASLDHLSQVYADEQACYWVIEKEGQILGGAGIAPLSGAAGTCELQKMYFSSALRGKGFAKRLACQAIAFAKNQGYQACYLETTAVLAEAVRLYEKLGFVHLDAPLGSTGHDACEMPMLLTL
ncbi:bifunctional helix-turn-helix transcriptional regulator/GNAT family N-acetyltransferase [Shewanella waksmanii]|uniref:bifunctional helix-turn-helix transcriptional regulator/GNAT family N-acetyltransferase n=1 Tax=Shewanella waksmanii TaxID=213783 RepID=UPI0004B47FEC|nr:helix-turn-helix domain-containing GNAT family N-acetyltransferase [Shewanella waksmanii]